MKKCNFALTVSIVALALSGIGKECYYDFNNFRNTGVKNFQVPLFLTEGKGGFTYEGFADGANGSDLRVFDSDGALLPYEIENWTPGDTAVVYGESSAYAGYHVMYYVGEGQQYSDYIAENELLTADVSAWLSELTAQYETSEGPGMRLVG